MQRKRTRCSCPVEGGGRERGRGEGAGEGGVAARRRCVVPRIRPPHSAASALATMSETSEYPPIAKVRTRSARVACMRPRRPAEDASCLHGSRSGDSGELASPVRYAVRYATKTGVLFFLVTLDILSYPIQQVV